MDPNNRPSSTRKYPKWLLPGIALGLLTLIGFVALMLYVVSAMMKSSDAYQQAIAIAKATPAVTQELGTPVEDGFFTTGRISVSGPSGYAALAIPLSGPNGSGTIYLEARKSVGKWSFSELVFEGAKSKHRVNLLNRQDADGVTDDQRN
jgi:hypothetical protein